MFFKKRETEIDDDFEYDDFDDFDLDDAGFQDATPKSGPRKAVSEIAGGFFSGLKTSVLDPSFHRKVLKESLPDGYVSHYDDASTILGEAKSIYNTASEEARKIKEEYAKEIRPAVDNWNKKSNSKLSNKISNIIGEPQYTADYSNTVSPEEAEYHNSANDIFGDMFAQSTSEGVNELTAQTREGNEVSKGLQEQTNTILTGVSNSLNQQNAFSEQVALKWKKKTLEIQFKQYFTARKQLEVQNQSLDYLKATIPNIVKNTALPDMVKVQTTELAGQMLAQKWIGGISDKAHESLAGAFGKIGTNIKQTIQDKSQLMLGSAGDVGSFFNMFNGEDEFTQTPVQMALNMIGGVGASQLVDTIFDKSKDTVRDKIDGTGLDYDKSNEAIKNLKLTLPALMSNLAQNGTGNDALDKLIEIAGIDSIYAPRSKTIQTAITGDALADQAVFNIETQKSITYTIPALLSEIHGELSSVRFAVGGTTPDDGDKLAMDWTSSRLNTRSRMKVNLGDRLYGKADADKALEVVYKMLGKFGYDASKIRSEGQLLSEDGKTVLLSKKDLNNLAVAIKTASYDRTKFFNIESLAEGSELIRDVESRMNIARFFQQELNVDDRDEDLSGAINLIGDKKAYLERKSAEKLKQQNILEEARIDAARDGIPESQIRRAVQEGQVQDLVAQGIVTIDDQGNYKLDPQALAEQTMFARHKDNRTSDEMFGIKINNEYGILERDQQERERMRILEEREQQKREEEEKRKEAEKQKYDNMTASEKAAHIFKEGKASFKKTKEDILNAKDFIKGTEATESAVQTAKQTFSEITDVLEEGAGVWVERFKASVQDSAFTGPKKLPDNFSNLEFKPKQFTDLPSEEPPRRKLIDSGLKPQPEERRKGIKIGDFIYGADVKVTRGKRKPEEPQEPPRRKIIDSGLKSQIDRLRRAKTAFSEEQASEIVSASSVVFTRLMDEAIKKQTQAPFANPGFKPDANFYDGGTITKFSGLIQNFAEGGMVKINTFYNKLVDKLLKTDPVKSYPVFTPVADKPTGFDNVLAPIKTAMDKETAEGGDAQLIVASAGEEVLSTKNGDAQAFRDFKSSGVWAKMKSHKEKFKDFVDNNFLRYDDFSGDAFKDIDIPQEDKSVKELTKNLFSEVKRSAEENTQGIRTDFRGALEDFRGDSVNQDNEKSIGDALKNVLEEIAITKRKLTDKREFTYVEDPSQFDLLDGLAPNQGYQKSGLLNGIKTKAGKLKDIDSEESRAKMLGGLLGIKDFGVDKLRAFSSMFESETSELGGSAKPSFSFSSKDKGINTITHQLKELIRLTSYVALNTGSTLEDLESQDPSLIEPIDGIRDKGPSLFSRLKDKFKRKPKQTDPVGMEDTENKENLSFWSTLKSKFKREDTAEQSEEPQDPEEEERGLLRRAIGGLFGMGWKYTKFSGKVSLGTAKLLGKGGWWGTKKTASGIGWAGKGLFGGTQETQDVYLEGERKPVMLAKDMAEGRYLSAEDGTPILKAEDIKGAVLDDKGNFVITEEDWNNRRVVIFTNEGKRSLFVRGVTQGAKLWANSFKLSSKLSWNIAKLPYVLATYEFKDDFNAMDPQLNGYIEKDIYVKGDRDPIIRAKLVGTGVYWTKDREPVETYSQLKDGVYDNLGNLILGPNEIDKGLYTPDGTLISKALGFVGSTIGFGANLGFNALKGLTKVYGAGFNLMSGAAKGLWNSLRGESKDFNIDGVDKYALMLQAQAASVDKLEMIRLLLDERIEAPKDKFNDKDGDGVRDGSYMDQIREKIAAKKKAKEDAKKTKEEREKEKRDKEERKGMFSGLTESITSGISGFFSKGLMFAALGGLVAANFGPQIATGIFSGIRSVLPWWLGGYSDEKKAEIKAGGGIIKHMMQTGAAAAEDSEGNRISTQPQFDENGNPLPQELDEYGNPIPAEGGSGLSSTTKFLLGGAAAAALSPGKIIKGTGKLAGKGVVKGAGLLGKGIMWGAGKTGLTAKLGLSGLGKKAAAKHLALKGGGLLKAGLKGGGGLLKGGAKLLTNPVARTAALNGARTAISTTLPALASNPIGWAVLGTIAVAVTVYAGYKLYKHLTKEDNHLATFRMAQYGYKMNNKKAVTKILDLEQYLAKYTIKATASTSAKISTQADTKKLFEIFGVNQSSKEESDRLLEWYYYRFKPVYLTWKTLFARAIGKVTIEDVDRLLFISDKLKMIDDADFHREELNPYDVPIAPFPGESEPDYTTREQVLEIRDKAIRELGKINQEKHDAKVKSAGGGSKGISDGVKPIDNMTASDTKSSATNRKQKEEEKERERQAKEAARQGMGNNKPEQKEQSWFNKFLFGDKSKTDDTAFSWGAKLGKKFRESVGNFFGGGSGGGGTYDASSKTLNLTSQDIEDLTKVTSTEAAAGLPVAEYNKQAAAIVDTIINRAVAKGQKFGKSIREVINAPRQFSKITGPKRLNPYGSVQNMPMSAVDKRAAAFVPQYIQARVAGQQPLVNGDLNYLNPHHSDESNLRAWGNDIVNQAKKSGQVYGKGQSIHYHGTTKDGLNAKPYGYKLALAGKVSAAQGSTGGSSGTAAKTNNNTTATAKPTPTQSATNPVPKKTTPPSTQNPVPANPTTPKNTNPPKDKTKKEVATTGVVGWINEKSANIVGGVTKVAGVVKEANKAMSGSPNSAPVTKTDGTTVNMTPQQKQAAIAKGEVPPAKPDGNHVAPQMTAVARPAKAAAYATKKARSSSIGLCAKYVRLALQHAGYPNMGGGIASAYMYATIGHLTKNGFKEIPANSAPQLGDVAVIDRNPKSKHGHICIYNGSKWVSDFIHAKPNVYSGVNPKIWLYRDAQFLNGAPAAIDGAFDTGADGTPLENGAPPGPPPYQMKIEKAREELEKRKAKRAELLAKAQAKGYKEEKVKIGFEGGRARGEIKGAKADTSGGSSKNKSISDKLGLPQFGKLGESKVITYDNTPSGYEPKVRESKIKEVEDNGAVGNSVGPKRDAETIRAEHAAKEAQQLEAAKNEQIRREKAEQQNQEQLKRLEARRQAEVVTANEQKIQIEKQNQIAATDSEIYKQQLDVQISMAKDIRRMAETLDKLYANPSQVLDNKSSTTITKAEPTKVPVEMNQHTRTVATEEPVSMKIR